MPIKFVRMSLPKLSKAVEFNEDPAGMIATCGSCGAVFPAFLPDKSVTVVKANYTLMARTDGGMAKLCPDCDARVCAGIMTTAAVGTAVPLWAEISAGETLALASWSGGLRMPVVASHDDLSVDFLDPAGGRWRAREDRSLPAGMLMCTKETDHVQV